MRPALASLAIALALVGCAAKGTPPKPVAEEAAAIEPVAAAIEITQETSPLALFRAFDRDTALEMFALSESGGRQIHYGAFKESDVGAVVFVNGKLAGTLDQRLARAFFRCRAYASLGRDTDDTSTHWHRGRDAWIGSLLAVIEKKQAVTLRFEANTFSAQQLTKNFPIKNLAGLRQFVDITSPSGALRAVEGLRDNVAAMQADARRLRTLNRLELGMDERGLIEGFGIDRVSFVGEAVMHSWGIPAMEVLAREGRVAYMATPAFSRLKKTEAQSFYAPGVDWSACTPGDWMRAVK